MKQLLLSFVTVLVLVPCLAQQNKQRPVTPVPDCGSPRPPMIYESPLSQTVCTGSNATFIASANSAGRSWQMSTDNGATWDYVRVNSYISPFDLFTYQPDTLIVFNVGTNMNGYLFRCDYAGPCNANAYTSTAILTVAITNSQINRQPQNFTTCKYTSADFTVAASGSSLSYQWQVSTNSGIDYTNMPGKTDTILHFDSVNFAMNNYHYRCVVNSECHSTIISDAALLTVKDESTNIITQPFMQAACIGSPVSLIAVASGNEVTYQWQKYSDGRYSDIDGATSSTLITSSLIPSTEEYICKISSSCKTIYSHTGKIFYVSPAEPVPLPTKYACSGESFTIPSFNYFTGEGIPGIAYHFQWQQSSDGGISYTNIPGDTLAYKTVTASPQLNNYQYRCYLNSTCFTGYSDTMLLLVDVPVAITSQPQNKNGCIGNGVTFSVKATGSISGYQWQRSTNGGISYQDFTCCGNGIWSPDFTLTYFTTAYNNYLYRCKVISNCFDTVYSNPATLSTFNNPIAPNDTATEVSCDSCKANISILFNSSAYAATLWGTRDSLHAKPGKYKFKVFNTPGCFDSAYAYVNVHEADTLKVCWNGVTRFHSNISGSSYQWQINTGTGFFDITDVNGITGSASPDITFQYNGEMQVRCKVDGTNYSNTTFVRITAYWTGAADSDWNNRLNWSCEEVPYYNATYVIIMPGAPHLPEVSGGNPQCKSLMLKPGAEIIIKPGSNLFIAGDK